MAAKFHPYLYEIDAELLQNRRILRYSLPFDAYCAIRDAQGISAEKYADIRGLSAVLGWAAPSVDLLGIEPSSKGEPATIVAVAIDPPGSSDDLQREIEVAMSIWLGIVLPDSSSAILGRLGGGGTSRRISCEERIVDPSLVWDGGCPVARDPSIYNLVTLFASRALEGEVINSGTANEGVLVSSGPRRSLYSGKTLIRYEPSREERRSTAGWWSEVFSVSALTTPECPRMRVSVNVSIRNFGSIHPARLSQERSRSMDVFLPVDPALARGQSRMRCIDLSTTRRDWLDAKHGRNDRQSADRKVMKAILEMSGMDFEESQLGLQVIIGERIGLYPRFGTVHGDQWATGGTGLPTTERASYLEFLDAHMEEAGFKRVVMERVGQKGPRNSLIVPIEDDPASLREALRRQAKSFEADESHLLLLQTRENGLERLSESIRGAIGEPDEVVDGKWSYGDDFSLRVCAISAGPVSELVSDVDRERLNNAPKNQWRKIEEYLRQERDKEACEAMSSYLNRQFDPPEVPWMALVEMNGALRDQPERDPYLLSYQAIAKERGVSQVRLFNPDEADMGDDEDARDASSERCINRNSFLDLLRSYGVCPVERQEIRLAAWWMIDTNGRQEYQAGGKGGMCTPVYVQCQAGEISVTLIDERDQLCRCSYPEAIQRISLGQVANLRFTKKAERIARMGQFFALATPRDAVVTVLFVEATNIRQVVPSLQNNANFKFDNLALGAVGGAAPIRQITPADNIAVVRITDEAAKAPCYWVEGNVQGTTAGLFKEPQAQRTYWLSRGLPTPLQLSAGPANKKSRHESGTGRLKHRRFPSLSEVTVSVKTGDFSELQLMTLTRRLMGMHIATDEKTILPFPLHEASLLSGAAR